MDAYETAFRHEALFYSGDDEFLAGTVPFVREAIRRDEQVLVVLGEENTALLKQGLGDSAAAAVTFAPMQVLGRNPARIIPAWRDFVDAWADGRPVRGVGEPIWPERTEAELVECHHHESLLNFAFDDGPPWWLLCPYDAGRLDPEVLETAHRTHPEVRVDGFSESSATYRADPGRGPFEGPLALPAEEPEELAFSSAAELVELRGFVAARAAAAGIAEDRVADFVLAVHELANNSVRHVGGEALLRIWTEPDALVAEIRDRGRIEGPLSGRERPSPEQIRGRGLWVVNQLCDLVQIRVLPDGNVVRVRMNVAA